LRPVGATDEELNEWTVKVIEMLKPTIAKGFPEYGFPIVDPFSLDKFDYKQKFGPVQINLAVRNIQIQGFSKFNTVKLMFDTQEKLMFFIFEVPELNIDAIYKASGTAVLFPITGSGPAHLKIRNFLK